MQHTKCMTKESCGGLFARVGIVFAENRYFELNRNANERKNVFLLG